MELALQVVLSAIGISSVWLTGDKNSLGWLVGILYNALWIVYAVFTAQYAFIVVCLVFIWVYARGYVKWRKDAVHQQRSYEAVEAIVQVPLADAGAAR